MINRTAGSSLKKEIKGEIQEASIAKFMRKRTQLVGFDYGLHKHTQYAVEFVDNALDAIEKFQWDARRLLNEIRSNTARLGLEVEKFLGEIEEKPLLEDKDADVSDENTQIVSVWETLNTPNAVKKLLKKFNVAVDALNEIIDIITEPLAKCGEPTEEEIFAVPPRVSEDDLKVNKDNMEEKKELLKSLYNRLKISYNSVVDFVENLESNPRFMFTLDRDLELESFSYIKHGKNGESAVADASLRNQDDSTDFVTDGSDNLSSEESVSIGDVAGENGDSEENSENKGEFDKNGIDGILEAGVQSEDAVDDEEAEELRKKRKTEIEKREELSKLVRDLTEFVSPITHFINHEPVVILRLREEVAPAVYQERGKKDAYLYTFEIFDNGTGMRPEDLLKYGKYLASSKSQKLRQTRGSQGFGAPSAFSDAQNTTGRPISVVSKHSSLGYGIASQFYTTEKNTKVYVIEPTKIECPFYHGTYVKLQYLNIKYKRGYVDTYIEKTAIMNSHVTLIYIDPSGNEHIYPRRIGYFPKEPKYALPHPSSVKIGDFQDLLRNSDNLTVTAFLTDNFVRMSSNLAKTIVAEAEFEIERKLKFLNIEIGYLKVVTRKNEDYIFVREEMRVYGRSTRERPITVGYVISDSDEKEKIWPYMEKYLSSLKEREKLEKEIREYEKEAVKTSDRKKIKEIKKTLKKLEKQIAKCINDMLTAKKELGKVLKNVERMEEITDKETMDTLIDIVKELRISKTRPSELTQTQIEYLFMAFKKQKYMAPPTDTAIPVGETALETAIIKQYNLTVSNKVEFFGIGEDHLEPIDELEYKLTVRKNLGKFLPESWDVGKNTVIPGGSEVVNVNADVKPGSQRMVNVNLGSFIETPSNIGVGYYGELLTELDLTHTSGDDFVAAYTRKPTSGKGLAFVVEAVMAYSPKRIPYARKASQVVTRYVNRTPKLRDNSDCALWIGIQSVNWKAYKVHDVFDNGIPRGNYVIYINCSGPYTHLMFKSQSKNALAEDEILLKEVKLCMEEIGRKLKRYMSKKEIREQRKKRSRLIEKNIPIFVTSVYNIAKTDPKYKDLKREDLENRILEALREDTELKPTLKKVRDNRGGDKESTGKQGDDSAPDPVNSSKDNGDTGQKDEETLSSESDGIEEVEKTEKHNIKSTEEKSKPERLDKLFTELTDTDRKILHVFLSKPGEPVTFDTLVGILGIKEKNEARRILLRLKALTNKKYLVREQTSGKKPLWRLAPEIIG